MAMVLADQPKFSRESRPARAVRGSGLAPTWLRQHDALILSKTRAGFDEPSVQGVSELLASIARRELGDLKFLVFEFAHGAGEAPQPAKGFAEIVAETAELIVDTPVITLAWARSMMSGADFDFAMHCSAIVADESARFSFAGEPFELFGLYAALGRRIGFVKTERLIESDSIVTAEVARNLMIVKDIVAPRQDMSAMDVYLTQFGRRYNASHAIFRAQRLAQPPIDRSDIAATDMQ